MKKAVNKKLSKKNMVEVLPINNDLSFRQTPILVGKKPTKKELEIFNKKIPSFKSGRTSRSKENTINKIKILGKTVCVVKDSYIKTLLRIGHKTKTIECNSKFLLLEKKEQQLMVMVVSGLLDKIDSPDNIKYSYADKKALEFMIKKYPKVELQYWLHAFIKGIMTSYSALNDLNTKRISKVIYFLKSKKDESEPNYKKIISSKK